jgi:NAD(P)-dependent dehydrogenase (short-subunit alcohol dehydrogenase family)
MNKVALVTGAAGGVGQAVVARLAAQGWQLIVCSREAEHLTTAFGDQHLQVVADCSTVAGARQILQAAKEHQLQPSALAHCVGNIRLGALHRMSEAVAAAKAGLEGLVRGAAATYAANGIRINAVAPGIMETPASAGIIASPTAREAAARQYPLPGIGSPDELAELMVWLLSESAARVTGQVWSLAGGFSSIRPLVK